MVEGKPGGETDAEGRGGRYGNQITVLCHEGEGELTSHTESRLKTKHNFLDPEGRRVFPSGAVGSPGIPIRSRTENPLRAPIQRGLDVWPVSAYEILI